MYDTKEKVLFSIVPMFFVLLNPIQPGGAFELLEISYSIPRLSLLYPIYFGRGICAFGVKACHG